MAQPLFSQAELAEILAYNRPKYVWAAVSEVYDLLLIALLLAVLVRPLWAWATRAAAGLDSRWGRLRGLPVTRAAVVLLDRLWGGRGWGSAVLFAVAVYFAVYLAYLPVSLYFALHEHAHGLSTYTFGGFVVDAVKGTAVDVLLRALLAFGLLGLARRLRSWWLWLGAVTFVLMLFASALDPYRARLYYEQRPLEAGELRARIDALMQRAAIPYSGVLVEKTSRASRKVQAYFAGQGPTRAIVLNDAILRELPADEILAAVAHEAGHVHEDKWPNRVGAAAALFGFLGLIEWLFRRSAARGWWGITARADPRVLPLVNVCLYLLMSVGAPLSAYLSRERERAADRYALELTRDPEAFLRMLVRATRVNKMDPDPPRWKVLRDHTHPPMAERIRAALRWRQDQGAGGRAPVSPRPLPHPPARPVDHPG